MSAGVSIGAVTTPAANTYQSLLWWYARLSWDELPEVLREGLADWLGSIISAEIQTGGLARAR
jgi:hypothetical protein